MLQVEDAELVGAKGITISTSLDCFYYEVHSECSCHLKWFPLGFPRGHSGDGCDLSSTLCTYNLRKGDSFVLSWAMVRRVRWGSIS